MGRNFRICSKCKWAKPASDFYKSSRTQYGLQPACKLCCKRTIEASRRKNKEKYCAQASSYKKENRALYREKEKVYRLKNPIIHRTRNAKRKARILNAMPTWVDVEAIKSVYKKANELNLTVDHIVPLKSKIVCGLHVPANLQLLTLEANTSKSNRVWPDMP